MTLTRDELLALPTVIDVPTAAKAFDIGTNHAYELIAAGRFPVEPLRLGRLIKIRTELVLQVLGFPARQSEGEAATASPTATTTYPPATSLNGLLEC